MDRRWLGLSLIVAVCGLTACAGFDRETTRNTPLQDLPILFEVSRVQSDMAQLALVEPFQSYWQAHKDRRWVDRFAVENLPKGLTQKFYVAYHEKAWVLKEVLVRSIERRESNVTLGITLSFVDPETSAVTKVASPDSWVLVDGAWKHVVSDPMLVGIK